MKKYFLFMLMFLGVEIGYSQVFKGAIGHVNDLLEEAPAANLTEFKCTVTGIGTLAAQQFNNVTINVTHEYTSDLIISLISPEGTQIILSNMYGNSDDGPNFTGTVFTQDPADPYIYEGTNPFTGEFRPDDLIDNPQGGFVQYDGENADGDWVLRFVDANPADAGELTDWSIQFGDTPPAQAPLAGFSYVATNFSVTFTDTSKNTPTGWQWDFGDGGTSSEQNPVHEYIAAGEYSVKLVASNDAGSDTVEAVVIIYGQGEAPRADFKFDAGSLSVSFTDLSTNSPVSWQWDFGDGTTSTDQNPSHTYTLAGSYAVKLAVNNQFGIDSITKMVEVSEGGSKPVAEFTFEVNALTVTFTDQSSNTPTQWAWTFGDGNSSSEQNPEHTYATDGVYNVCLTATNAVGSDTNCQQVPIVVGGLSYSSGNSNFKSYPNPANDKLYIENLSGRTVNVQLTNMLGTELLSYQSDAEVSGVAVSTLPAGNYVVTISDERDVVVRKIQIVR